MFHNIFVMLGVIFNIIILGVLTFGLMIFLLFSYYGSNLPTAEEIENYKPSTISRVYDSDGNILGVFGAKKRIYTPIEDIPALVKNAFISAEDKNFYQHLGFDPLGLLKAIMGALRGQKLRGASTITQQVMKNFLLSGERTGKRKIKEIILASKIEKVLKKDQILNVYLNEIYLGQGAYGVTAAAIVYFDKKLEELNIGEAAFLAALPKAPSFYHPIRQKTRSIQRRNFVIKELYENGFISLAQSQEYIQADLITILSSPHKTKVLSLKRKASYFTDAVRKSILLKYDRSVLETNGLTIRSTLNDTFQLIARETLQEELIKFDQSIGTYRGVITNLSHDRPNFKEELQSTVLELKANIPIENWFIASVDKVSKSSALIKVFRKNDSFEMAELLFRKSNWVKNQLSSKRKTIAVRYMSELLSVGDIIFVSRELGKNNDNTDWILRQIPEIQGALIVMEPNSGKVMAMQGGFSHSASGFNRALQANRQPGSLFKPFVYLAALKNGYNPNSIIVDAPISVKQLSGVWRPQNASDKWFGVAPLRKGLEYSRNLMTVRLAKAVGMTEVKKYAELFGLYEDMPSLLSYSLGAGETTLLKLVRAYSIFANGGFEVEPTFFDLVQDRFGNTIYQHGNLRCLGCENFKFNEGRKPIFLNMAKRLVDPVSIAQVNSMLQGVVKRGTAAKTVGTLKQAIAGKTGTTNKSKDVWFIGYTPNVVVGCYMGYDLPRSLGNQASGGLLCGNAFKTFMQDAYGDKLSINWNLPREAKIKKINYNTGEVTNHEDQQSIKEIFRKNQSTDELNSKEVIDGGFEMGHDFLYLTEPISKDSHNKSFLRKSFGAIITGDQY